MWVKIDERKVFMYSGGVEYHPNKSDVVMLHGAGMDSTVWQQQSRYLAHHGWNVLAVDLPGHGLSEGLALESVELAADWLNKVLNVVGLDKVSLIGHSLGALICLDFASRYEKRVSKLGLLGITPKMPVHETLLKAAKSNDSIAGEFIVGWGFGKNAHRGGNSAPGIWMIGGGLRLLKSVRRDVLGIDLSAVNDYKTGLASASRISCSTLILLGDSDRMTPMKNARILEELIDSCETHILSRTGHFMMIESPGETLKILFNFLNNREQLAL